MPISGEELIAAISRKGDFDMSGRQATDREGLQNRAVRKRFPGPDKHLFDLILNTVQRQAIVIMVGTAMFCHSASMKTLVIGRFVKPHGKCL